MTFDDFAEAYPHLTGEQLDRAYAVHTATDTVASFGYSRCGRAAIFDLPRGAGLPNGWHSSPDVYADKGIASADAISARLERNPGPVEDAGPVKAVASQPDAALTARIAELEAIVSSGQAENQRLVAELSAAEEELDAAAREMSAMKTDATAKAATDLAADTKPKK